MLYVLTHCRCAEGICSHICSIRSSTADTLYPEKEPGQPLVYSMWMQTDFRAEDLFCPHYSTVPSLTLLYSCKMFPSAV